MAATRSKRILQMALRQDNKVEDLTDTSNIEDSSSGSEYCPPTDEESNDSYSLIFDGFLRSDENVFSADLDDIRAETSSVIPTAERLVLEDKVLANVSNVSKSKRVRRKHRCSFCEQDVGNFSRHLLRNHFDEIAVQEINSLARNSKIRKKLIDKLRREGDFCSENIVPVLVAKKDDENSNYIVCKFCQGYYRCKSLRRHAKKCFFNPDPSKRFNAQIEGQTLMVGPFGPNDPLKVSGLLSMLRADDISLTAKKDRIICEVVRRYIKSHKEKHLLLVAKRHMRRLARLLIEVRKLQQEQTLKMIDILVPNKFKVLVKATQSMASYDEKSRNFKSPSLALQMGTLIKSAINTAYSLEVQKENPSKEVLEKFQTLIRLIETDWAHEVSSEAGQNLAINKFNKPTLIPVAEDIKKFEKYLKQMILEAKTRLVENSDDLKAFRKLLEGIFCSVMIFNKRRVGELQRMTLLEFLKNYDSIPSSEFEKALTNSEKILYRSLKRVVIRGKRGRGVPVLFDKGIVQDIEFLIPLRNNFNLEDNPYLFGLPNTKSPITGYVIMQKHARNALRDIHKASLLTSTRLRKHLATITQIFKMGKNELEQLATFMGHTQKTHSEFYRLPDDVYQTAKVSKLLLLSKNSAFEKFKGKRLDDIDLDDYLVEDDNSDEEEEDQYIPNAGLEEQTSQLTSQDAMGNIEETNTIALKNKKGDNKIGRKRTLVAWTVEQKRITEEFFKNHIKKRIPPKKPEVMNLIEKYPDLFRNKSWPTIKVYVCNKYRSK